MLVSSFELLFAPSFPEVDSLSASEELSVLNSLLMSDLRSSADSESEDDEELEVEEELDDVESSASFLLLTFVDNLGGLSSFTPVADFLLIPMSILEAIVQDQRISESTKKQIGRAHV